MNEKEQTKLFDRLKEVERLRKQLFTEEKALLDDRKKDLWQRVSDLSRSDMQWLRNMLNEHIFNTYDADDE